jgi:hypothetical protein
LSHDSLELTHDRITGRPDEHPHDGVDDHAGDRSGEPRDVPREPTLDVVDRGQVGLVGDDGLLELVDALDGRSLALGWCLGADLGPQLGEGLAQLGELGVGPTCPLTSPEMSALMWSPPLSCSRI